MASADYAVAHLFRFTHQGLHYGVACSDPLLT
jgi:hypothetical protein